MTNSYFNYGRNLYYYDVNSLYPYCMLNSLPVKYENRYDNLTQSEFLEKFGFYYCRIEIPDTVLHPVVPVNIFSTENKIIYPIGTIEGFYFSEEVKNFIELGYKVHISYLLSFTQNKSLFTDYIAHFYELKQSSSQLSLFYKMMLNGLFGYISKDPLIINDKIIHKDHYNDFNLKKIFFIKKKLILIISILNIIILIINFKILSLISLLELLLLLMVEYL